MYSSSKLRWNGCKSTKESANYLQKKCFPNYLFINQPISWIFCQFNIFFSAHFDFFREFNDFFLCYSSIWRIFREFNDFWNNVLVLEETFFNGSGIFFLIVNKQFQLLGNLQNVTLVLEFFFSIDFFFWYSKMIFLFQWSTY